jgi:hypothetical protein
VHRLQHEIVFAPRPNPPDDTGSFCIAAQTALQQGRSLGTPGAQIAVDVDRRNAGSTRTRFQLSNLAMLGATWSAFCRIRLPAGNAKSLITWISNRAVEGDFDGPRTGWLDAPTDNLGERVFCLTVNVGLGALLPQFLFPANGKKSGASAATIKRPVPLPISRSTSFLVRRINGSVC